MSRNTSHSPYASSKFNLNTKHKSPSGNTNASVRNFSSFRQQKSAQNALDSPTQGLYAADYSISESTGHFGSEINKNAGPHHIYFDLRQLTADKKGDIFQPQPQRQPLQQRDNSPLRSEQLRNSNKQSPLPKSKSVFHHPLREGGHERSEYNTTSSQLLSPSDLLIHNSENNYPQVKQKLASNKDSKGHLQRYMPNSKENSHFIPDESQRRANKSKSPDRSRSFQIDRSDRQEQTESPNGSAGHFNVKRLESELDYISATFRVQGGERTSQRSDSSKDGKKHQHHYLQGTNSTHSDDRQSGVIEQIRNNLQNITSCKLHNQPFSLFNTVTKQIACLECVYSLQVSNKKQQPYISLKNAAPIIAEINKVFKMEANDRIKIFDDNVNLCHSSIQLLQHNFDSMLSLVNKEFQSLHEEMLARRELLIETARSITQTQINEFESKLHNLNFLNSCFKDARDIDPFQNFELGVHFYAVFNLLRSTLKNHDSCVQKPSAESLNILEFPNRSEAHVVLANYGKIQYQKPAKAGGTFRKLSGSTISPTKFLLTPVKSKKQEQYIKNNSSGSKINKSPLQVRNNKLQIVNENQVHSSKKPEQKALNSQVNHKFGSNEAVTRKSFNEFLSRTDMQDACRTDTPPRDKFPAHFLSSPQHSSPDNGLIHAEYEEHRLENLTPPRNYDGGEPVGNKPHFNNQFMKERSSVKEADRLAAEIEAANFMKEQEHQPSQISSRYLFQDSKLQLKEMDLMDVLPSQKITGTQLLYQLSRDGTGSATFHAKVDGHSPIIVFVKANSNYLFGYYTTTPFSKEDRYSTSDKAYLFSVQNPSLKGPMVFPIKTDKKFIAIYQSSKSPCLGSTLHQKQDLWLQ